jgi:peroxiredoxin
MSKISTRVNYVATTMLTALLNVSASAADRISDFSLIDHTGKYHQLTRYSNRDAIVLIVHDGGSEVAEDVASDLAKVAEHFAESRIKFFMINSSGIEDKAIIAAAAKDAEIEFPILIDETQLVAEELGITRAFEALIINPSSKEVLYRGAINDRFSEGSTRRRARDHYLQDALQSMLDGEEITVAATVSKGGAIQFQSRDVHQAAGISYAREVAQILEARCVTCHQEGGIAPFAMSSHQMVQGWSPMIRETLYTKRMPPGQIDNDYLKNFHNINHITPEETQTLVHWIDNGSINNDDSDPLTMTELASNSWSNGEPDIIVPIPSQSIPASGVVEYRNLQIPLDIDDDIWVKAVEFLPGDTSVLHHIIAFSYGPGGVNQFEILNQGIGLGAYAPGNKLNLYPKDTGYPLEVGGGLMLQLHYTTSGREAVDASSIGLYLYDEEPRQAILGGSAAIMDLHIPANVEDHQLVATKLFRNDAYLTMVGPHMHYRGKEARFTLKYPDGSEEMILNVPNYQFNWQKTYDFIEPRFVPAGTEMVFEGAFDNSEMNPFNPDPTIEITWGEQTWNEMFFGFIRYYDALD